MEEFMPSIPLGKIIPEAPCSLGNIRYSPEGIVAVATRTAVHVFVPHLFETMDSNYRASWMQLEKVGEYEGAEASNDDEDPYNWLKGGHCSNEMSLYILSFEWCEYPEQPNESPLLVVLLSNGFIHIFRKNHSAVAKHHFAVDNKAFAWSMHGMELVCDFHTSTTKAPTDSDVLQEKGSGFVGSNIEAFTVLSLPVDKSGGILSSSRQLLITASTTLVEIWEISSKSKNIVSFPGSNVSMDLHLLKQIAMETFVMASASECIGRDTIVTLLPFHRTIVEVEQEVIYLAVAYKKKGVAFLRISLASSSKPGHDAAVTMPGQLLWHCHLPGRLLTTSLSFPLPASPDSIPASYCMILYNAEMMFCFPNPFSSKVYHELPHNHQYDVTTALHMNSSLHDSNDVDESLNSAYFMTCSMDGGRRYWRLQYEHTHTQTNDAIMVKQLKEIDHLTVQSLVSPHKHSNQVPDDMNTKFPIIFPNILTSNGQWNEIANWFYGGTTDHTSSLQFLTYKIDPAIEQTRETQLNLQLLKPRLGFHVSIPISWYLLLLQASILPSTDLSTATSTSTATATATDILDENAMNLIVSDNTMLHTETNKKTLFVSPFLLHQRLLSALSVTFSKYVSSTTSTTSLIPWSLFLLQTFDTLRPYFRLAALPPVPEKLYEAVLCAAQNRKREKVKSETARHDSHGGLLGNYYEDLEPIMGKGKAGEVDGEEENYEEDEEEEEAMTSDSEDDGTAAVSAGKKSSKKTSSASKKSKSKGSPTDTGFALNTIYDELKKYLIPSLQESMPLIVDTVYHTLLTLLGVNTDDHAMARAAFLSMSTQGNSNESSTEQHHASYDPLERKFRIWQMYHNIVSYYHTLHGNKDLQQEASTGYLQKLFLEDVSTHCTLLPTIRYNMTILRCLFAARRLLKYVQSVSSTGPLSTVFPITEEEILSLQYLLLILQHFRSSNMNSGDNIQVTMMTVISQMQQLLKQFRSTASISAECCGICQLPLPLSLSSKGTGDEKDVSIQSCIDASYCIQCDMPMNRCSYSFLLITSIEGNNLTKRVWKCPLCPSISISYNEIGPEKRKVTLQQVLYGNKITQCPYCSVLMNEI